MATSNLIITLGQEIRGIAVDAAALLELESSQPGKPIMAGLCYNAGVVTSAVATSTQVSITCDVDDGGYTLELDTPHYGDWADAFVMASPEPQVT